MTGFEMDRRRWLAASAIAVTGLPWQAMAQGAAAAGVVRSLSGQAEVERDAAVRQLRQDGDVFILDRIATGAGSRAAIALGAATELRLGSEARIRIDRFLMNAGGVITLEGGAMGFDRDPARERGTLNVRSSYGLIAVRGTRFFAGPSNGVFGVFVERGSVAVTGGGRQVVLGAGEGTDIAQPGGQPTAPRTWGERRIRLALAQVY